MKTRISELIGATNLEANHQNALEDHARYLLTMLPSSYSTVFIDPELPGKKTPVIRLKKIANAMHKARMLDAHPVPAMVASVAGDDIGERKQHEMLKAWVLVASLALYDRGQPVLYACRRVRRLAKTEDRWLFDELLDLPKPPPSETRGQRNLIVQLALDRVIWHVILALPIAQSPRLLTAWADRSQHGTR